MYIIYNKYSNMCHMINNFFNMLRRRKFLYPSNMFIYGKRNINLENIVTSVTVNRMAGVNILFLPQNSGKSISTFNALKTLFDQNKISDCIIIDCSEFKFSLQDEIKKNIWKKINFINNDMYSAFTLNSLFKNTEKRAVIVFDQFEALFDKKYDCDNIEHMILCMAHDTVSTNTYTIQININNKEIYDKLCKLNNGQKINPFFEYKEISML